MGNDFSDFQQYFIKCTIPRALARIKDGSGDTRIKVKFLLIKILKFNDNSNNFVLLPESFCSLPCPLPVSPYSFSLGRMLVFPTDR